MENENREHIKGEKMKEIKERETQVEDTKFGTKVIAFLGLGILSPIIIYSFYKFQSIYNQYSEYQINQGNIVQVNLLWIVVFMFIILFCIAILQNIFMTHVVMNNNKQLKYNTEQLNKIHELVESLDELGTNHEIDNMKMLEVLNNNILNIKKICEDEVIMDYISNKDGGKLW